jgi:spermidine synthase
LARDSFLLAGAGMRRPQNFRELHARIREPLLACVRKSRDFAAAYNPLLALAHEIYRTDPSAARELLVVLEDAQTGHACRVINFPLKTNSSGIV